ncbi:MAG: cupredoxin domain-containing protein [Gammaproteobacteria bacterium]|nr:cupredoxin domain-containing protein [Gammaproteobacteria bacterium]
MNVKKYPGFGLGLSLLMALPLHAENLPSFNLTANDGHFSPDKLEIPANQKIMLVVKNEGTGPEEFESSDLNREKLVMPGKSADIIIGPLKAGAYGFHGEFHPQTARGQIVAK